MTTMSGGFVTDGCQLMFREGLFFCQCDHMTDFSVIFRKNFTQEPTTYGVIPLPNLYDLKVPRTWRMTSAIYFMTFWTFFTCCLGLYGFRDFSGYKRRETILKEYARYLVTLDKEIIKEREKEY